MTQIQIESLLQWQMRFGLFSSGVGAIHALVYGDGTRFNLLYDRNEGLKVIENESRQQARQLFKMEAELSRHLLERHGPVIGADKIWQILEFKTKDSFERSFQRGRVDLPLFKIPGRDGLFVLAPALARQIVKLAIAGQVVKADVKSESN